MFWKKKSESGDASGAEVPGSTPTRVEASPPENPAHSRVLAALSTVMDPDLKRDLVSLGMIKNLSVGEERVSLTVELTTPACPLKEVIGRDVEAAIGTVLPGVKVELAFSARVRSTQGGGARGAQNLIPDVKNVVLVASGKGGVGKSTVAANLACALAATGAKVGLMDADIYGPSIPTMFRIGDKPVSRDGKTIDPIPVFGLTVMSIGFFVPPEKAVVWRGPMVTGAIVQFLRDVKWGALDYLICDLPPGTGDAQLTFAQQLQVTGAVIVSTPQDVALSDVIRAKAMFDTVTIPILGMVENMSYFLCDGCGKRHEIFAHGGARAAAARFNLPFLGEVPIELGVRETGDEGCPLVVARPDSPAAASFRAIAGQVAAQISVQQVAAEERARQALRVAARGGSVLTAGTRIAEVLQSHSGARQVLEAHGVDVDEVTATVSQAARLAGVDEEALLRALGQGGGGSSRPRSLPVIAG